MNKQNLYMNSNSLKNLSMYSIINLTRGKLKFLLLDFSLSLQSRVSILSLLQAF